MNTYTKHCPPAPERYVALNRDGKPIAVCQEAAKIIKNNRLPVKTWANLRVLAKSMGGQVLTLREFAALRRK